MKTTLRGKMIAGLSGLLLLAGMVGHAQAGECISVDRLGYTPGEVVYAFSVPSTIQLSGNEAPGTVLWTSPAVGGSKSTGADCPGRAGSAGLIDYWGSTSSSVGSYNVMPTNVAGIGYSIEYPQFIAGVRGYPSNPDGPTPSNNLNTFQTRLRFIKTSAPYFSGSSATTNRSGDFSTWYVGTNQLRFANFTVSNTTTFNKPDGGGGGGGGGGSKTCISTSRTVNLGEVNARTLNNGEGSKSVYFEVEFQCSAMPAGQNATISLSPQGNAIAGDNCDSTMRNASSGTAKNVGIRIVGRFHDRLCWNQSKPYIIIYGGSFIWIPFYAWMKGTGGTVTAGTVVGKVVLTVTYS